MANYEIGLTGLNVAQRAIEIIGTNIANVSTAGYHRQTIKIQPVTFDTNNSSMAGGAKVDGVHRSIDVLLESQIVKQSSLSGQLAQELMTLQTIEQSLGNLENQGLMLSLTSFFNSLRQLAAQPDSRSLQEQAIWAASGLAGEFRNMDSFLQELDHQILLEAQNVANSINSLVDEIAQLNTEVQGAITRGSNGNLLMDRRDQAMVELAELIPLQTNPNDLQNATQSVIAWGTPLITSGSTTHLEVATGEDGKLGFSVQGANYLQTEVSGGKLGALIELKNSLLADVRDNIEDLATTIMSEINKLHVQGIGSAGSFASLAGTPVASTVLSGMKGVTAGTFYVRITDTVTGDQTRHAVSVNPATDTFQTIADKINALRISGDQPLTASVAGAALRIESNGAYKFDFSPALLSEPTTSTFTGASSPTITGVYTGATQTYTVKVTDAGDVGAGTVLLSVKDGEGNLVKTLSVGEGYAAGDALEIDKGISIAFSMGDLKLDEQFTVLAVGSSDSSGFLSAAGMNVLFRGTGASDMQINEDILANPDKLATGINGSDNVNISKLADVEFLRPASLGSKSAQDFYQQMVTRLGQQVQIRTVRKETLDSLLQQLESQRDIMSGVDINEQAAQLIVYERMFQSLAKYISTVDNTVKSLMDLI
jgi:flagellar hook-associated protein 1 FlgK